MISLLSPITDYLWDIFGLSYILNNIYDQFKSEGIVFSFAILTVEKLSFQTINLKEIYLSRRFIFERVLLMITSVFGIYIISKFGYIVHDWKEKIRQM